MLHWERGAFRGGTLISSTHSLLIFATSMFVSEQFLSKAGGDA